MDYYFIASTALGYPFPHGGTATSLILRLLWQVAGDPTRLKDTDGGRTSVGRDAAGGVDG